MRSWRLCGVAVAFAVSSILSARAEGPNLGQLWADLMNTARSNPKLSERALSDKLLMMLIKGTSEAFRYEDPAAEEKLNHIFFDCAVFSGPRRVIFMDTALRLALVEVVATSGDRNITYVVRSTPWGVTVDSISPPSKWNPKSLVIRVLTARGNEVLNTTLTTEGIKTLCEGKYGPIWG